MKKAAHAFMADRPTAPLDAICLSDADNVATVLRPVAAGEAVRVGCNGQTRELRAQEAIAFCHKVSLVPIGAGAAVVKYGHVIGSTIAAVGQGRHVHVHNMRSNRAQK